MARTRLPYHSSQQVKGGGRTGRPPVREERASRQFGIRLTPEQDARWRALAKRYGGMKAMLVAAVEALERDG